MDFYEISLLGQSDLGGINATYSDQRFIEKCISPSKRIIFGGIRLDESVRKVHQHPAMASLREAPGVVMPVATVANVPQPAGLDEGPLHGHFGAGTPQTSKIS